MNLLDDLAKNSFRSDSLFFQISSSITSLSLQSSLHQNDLSAPEGKTQKEQNKSICIANLISEQKNGTLGSGGTTGQEYFEKYRDKVTKISAMVSLLSAKNRKIQYQFMVHLERWVKSNNPGTEITEIKESTGTHICSTKKDKKKDCSLIFSDINQLVVLLERKAREAIRVGFTRVNKRFKFVLKIEFLGSFLKSFETKQQRKKQRKAFELMKVLPKKQQIQKLNIKIAKSIKFPLQLKALSVKKFADSNPLPSIAFTYSSQHPKIPFQYPQNRPTQNVDYYDTLAIFMDDDPKSKEKISQFDLSFSNNVCLSVFDAEKETLSQKSFIKQLSDVELTTAPLSAFAKRKISDFTISDAENRALQNFSHVVEKKSGQTGLNLIKSEVYLHNIHNENLLHGYFQPEERKFLSPRTNDFCTFSKIELQASEPAKRYSLQKSLIPRSGSEAKEGHRPCYSDVKKGIEREYEEEMDKYKTFKKYLKKRRESTMKQIKDNQQILKKLMLKFQKSKQKAQKLKISLKPKCQKDKMATSMLKKSHLNSKTSTPSRTPHKDQSSQSVVKKGSSSLIKKDEDRPVQKTVQYSLQKDERKSVNFDRYSKNMDIFYNYVKQKKILDSSKATPKNFSPSQKCNSLSSSKKQSKSNIFSVAQKNLLAISKFPCHKEQRVDLRVDLSKPKQKKTSRHPQKQKLKIAQVQVFNSKAKKQLK